MIGAMTAAPDRWRWARRAAPWAIAAVTVAALLVQYPIDRIAAELGRGDALALVLPAAGALAVMWFVVTLADAVVLIPAAGPIRYVDLLRAKAGVTVLNALGTAVNYGGLAVWVQRRFRCPPAAAAGTVLLITLSDLAAVAALASLAVALGGDALPPAAREQVGALAPAVAATALVLLALRPRVARPLWTAWAAVPRAARLAGVALRCVNLAILVAATTLAARGFGLAVPAGAMAIYVPILLVIGALPVNVAGFGPVQAAWVALLAPWADGAQVLAFQFLWHLVLLVALVVRGAPFLRGAVADVTRSSRGSSP